MGQAKRIQRQEGVQGVEKVIALEAVRSYCANHGYSMEKLRQNRLYLFEDEAIFAMPSPVKPAGLTNDIATQPLPTLIIRMKNDEFHVEATEHADRYLMN